MHLTSVPSKHGIGDLGPAAYKFVDFLSTAGQNYWQLLPLNHTTAKTAHSPYNCLSAFAGNPLLISLDLLRRDGLLTKAQVSDPPSFPVDKVNCKAVSSYKGKLLDAAFARFHARKGPVAYDAFVQEHRDWLEPFATFVALRRHFKGRLWCDWPKAIREARKAELRAVSKTLSEAIERERFLQYAFYRQYLDLKRYCHRQGIQVMGDVPIYVAYDSADVWSHPDLFKLTSARKPRCIAGVPPDYFSETGQLWGNPVYDWSRVAATRFDWWIRRMKHNLLLFDFVRIDHFRGLVAYWEVPAGHRTARRGKWVQAPHAAFFRELFRHVPFGAIFAEDLGHITPDVREVVATYGLPGMRVLQFAFDGDPARNPHMPHNHIENSIVCTGTHDNNTTRGWFEKEMGRQRKKRLFAYLGRAVSARGISWELMRLAMASVSKLALVPMQDVLGLGEAARMNVPAKPKNNWCWRMRPGRANARVAKKLRELTATYGRV